LSTASNAQRHADLGLELARSSLAYIEGIIGQNPSNQWLGEASHLAFGLKLEAAKTLSRGLKHIAIVWSVVGVNHLGLPCCLTARCYRADVVVRFLIADGRRLLFVGFTRARMHAEWVISRKAAALVSRDLTGAPAR